jgi:hypothetical protein
MEQPLQQRMVSSTIQLLFPTLHHSDETHYIMMLSNEDSVASPTPLYSNDELVKINPMYQHLIDNDPDAYYPGQLILKKSHWKNEKSSYRVVSPTHYTL